jgi:hypothetical protein
MSKAKTKNVMMTAVVIASILLCAGHAAIADHYGPGRVGLKVWSGPNLVDVGIGGIWNSRDKLHVQVEPTGGWRIREAQIYVGADPIPTTSSGNPKIGKFPYKREYPAPYQKEYNDGHILRRTWVLDLEQDLGFSWGQSWEQMRVQNVAVHLELVQVDSNGDVIAEEGAWCVPDVLVSDVILIEQQSIGSEAEENTSEASETAVKESKDSKQEVAKHEHEKAVTGDVTLEVEDMEQFGGSQWGWWFRYELVHPARANFVGPALVGIYAETPTFAGNIDGSAGFDFFPSERVELSIGSVLLGEAIADYKMTVLDFFEAADMDDERVINMTRLLQSLDADGDASGCVEITSDVTGFFEEAVLQLGIESVDFADDNQIENLITMTIEKSMVDGETPMVAVSKEAAQASLQKMLSNIMFRKNIPTTPGLLSNKGKINIMPVWVPARKANGEPASFLDDSGNEVPGIPYYDNPILPVDNGDGTFTYDEPQLIRVATEAKPILVVYLDENLQTSSEDVFAAVSRDDGNTWQRTNISGMAEKSSFTLANGEIYYGDCKKPVVQIKDNRIFVAWTSAYADVGEISTEDDDPSYEEDIWGVSGKQGSVDYTSQGFPEIGEVPYKAVWVARGIILTAEMLTQPPWDSASETGEPHYSAGDVVWFAAERLTSGRRDAFQLMCAGATGAGFAAVWQEDPDGLLPGEGDGPGSGWSGATTNHKTDIWYSYITWEDFAEVDINAGGCDDSTHDSDDSTHTCDDSTHDSDDSTHTNDNSPGGGGHDDSSNGLETLIPMSLPVRLSDNDAVNTDNIMVELDADGYPVRDVDGNFIPVMEVDPDGTIRKAGSHSYGYLLDGLWNGTDLYEKVNNHGELKRVLITTDGRLLDGNTGASRPNISMQTYTKSDGTKSAWAVVVYEESKGVGYGPPAGEEHLDVVAEAYTGDGHEDPDSGHGEDPNDSCGGHEDPNGVDDHHDDRYACASDIGKKIMYHSFDFRNPDLVSGGNILNLPETDANGNPVYLVEGPYLGSDPNGNPIPNPNEGQLVLDYKGDPHLAYENARRARLIIQPKNAMGASKTVLLTIYRQGEEGKGASADIMMRRCVAAGSGNPYAFANFVPEVQNLSSVSFYDPDTLNPEVDDVTNPLVNDWIWINPYREPDATGDGVKVIRWVQTEENLFDDSGSNPYEDARAHRGQIRGDFVVVGYCWTPNWAAAAHASDKYDLYIRRSFDGGATWTTDPSTTGDTEHVDIYMDPDGLLGWDIISANSIPDDEIEPTKYYEVATTYAPGVFEPARNLSRLKNHTRSIGEPRLFATPGTIKDPATGAWTGIAEDKQNKNVFYVAYGTSANQLEVEKLPEDLYWSFTTDKGTSFKEINWVLNPDIAGDYPGQKVLTSWDYLAKGEPEQGEAQLRMTPDGSRLYSCWLEESDEGSDIMFRRIIDSAFPGQ